MWPASLVSDSGPTARVITEERRGDVPLFVHPEWQQRFPWLVQGTTCSETGNFSGADRPGQLEKLSKALGFESVVIGKQVHEAAIAFANERTRLDSYDGLIANEAGVLLAISIADCVPVFVVDEHARRVAALHAGWRGTAAGIVSRCIEMMSNNVHVHLGPAICGKCYEVGPEVHAALGLPEPKMKTPVDLRLVIAQQCAAKGVPESNMTTSSWCTQCGESPFYSHRAGHPQRQVGVIGIK
jgi:polyphenol oxidase